MDSDLLDIIKEEAILPSSTPKRGSPIMYAIAFDLDGSLLTKHYPKTSSTNAYKEIGDYLTDHDFVHQQGSLYYGDKEKITMVKAFTVVINMSKSFPWLKKCVKDIRILQIMDSDDLKPIL